MPFESLPPKDATTHIDGYIAAQTVPAIIENVGMIEEGNSFNQKAAVERLEAQEKHHRRREILPVEVQTPENGMVIYRSQEDNTYLAIKRIRGTNVVDVSFGFDLEGYSRVELLLLLDTLRGATALYTQNNGYIVRTRFPDTNNIEDINNILNSPDGNNDYNVRIAVCNLRGEDHIHAIEDFINAFNRSRAYQLNGHSTITFPWDKISALLRRNGIRPPGRSDSTRSRQSACNG